MTRAHQAARSLKRGLSCPGDRPRGHVEVEGIIGDLEQFDVIESTDEVRSTLQPTGDRLPDDGHRTPRRINSSRDRRVGTRKPRSGSSTRFACRPRSISVSAGAAARSSRRGRGGRRPALEQHARTGRSLPGDGQARHARAVGRDDLDPAWFERFATVGLTAGTSTLAETIDEVHRALVWIGVACGGANG